MSYRKRSKQKKMSNSFIGKLKTVVKSIEKKHYDRTISNNFGSDAACSVLTNISQGDTSSTRTGLKVYAKNLLINGSIGWSSTATQESMMRVIIFIDKNPNGAVPAITNVLESGAINSLYNNIYEGKRFVVLKDVRFSNTDAHTSIPKETAFSWKIPINRSLTYLSGSNDSASLGSNNLFAVMVSDVTTASGDTAAVNYTTRVYYTDL